MVRPSVYTASASQLFPSSLSPFDPFPTLLNKGTTFQTFCNSKCVLDQPCQYTVSGCLVQTPGSASAFEENVRDAICRVNPEQGCITAHATAWTVASAAPPTRCTCDAWLPPKHPMLQPHGFCTVSGARDILAGILPLFMRHHT